MPLPILPSSTPVSSFSSFVSFWFLAAVNKMAKLSTALLLLFLLGFTFLHSTVAGSEFCDSKCKMRCSKAGIKDRCLKYCGICCKECKCVPSGTYGKKEECPCYRDKLNKKGKPKCP